MPVVMIKGPPGLSKKQKGDLIKETMLAMVRAYQIPDDRVYIDEISLENVGHTQLLAVTQGEGWAVQSEPARIFVEIVAPPGIPLELKRTLIREVTEIVGRAYGRTNLREVLVSLDQHKIEDFAANGLIQSENPDMAPFADMFRGR